MSLTSALARIELEYLGSVVRRCADVVKDVDHISTLQEDGIGGAFEKSLRVKGMIDALEVLAQHMPSWNTLAALVSSEYRLWVLNAETPLRHNPFLSHWVEAIQRLEVASQSQVAPASPDGVSAADIAATRLEMVKRLLSQHTDALASATPQQLYDTRYPGTPFDVQPYIRMLEEEDIYDPSSTSIASVNALLNIARQESADDSSPASRQPNNTSQTPTLEEWAHPRKLTFLAFKDDLVARLGPHPDQAFYALTHLPIALPALELLTNLITNHTLDIHHIDSKQVVLSFVQHALRLVEYMGQPPSTDNQPPYQTPIGIEPEADHGREAQGRAIRLLLLFVKNLIRKGLVDIDPQGETTLYYEIQEICVRYMWMKEVREFRMWIREGETTEEGEDE